MEKNDINLNTTLKNLEAIVWKIDKDGVVLLLEGKELDHLGLDRANILGKVIYEFESIYCCMPSDYAKKALNGEVCEYEEEFCGKNFQVKYSPMYDEKNKISGAVAIAIDITNIKKLQKKLLENETRFKLASEGASIGWWHWNIKNDVLSVDENLAGFVGYKVEELIPLNPRTWNKFIYAEDVEKSKELLHKYFDGQSEYYECEFRIKKKNGKLGWVINRGRIIERDENNKPYKMSGVYIDITDRKRNENIKLLLAQKEDEEKIRNEFLANISHELRTPINVIYSAVQLETKYINDLDRNQLLKYNQTIKQNCLRLIKMTNNLIDMTRLETGFFTPVFKAENIVELVEDITLSIISYADIKNIKVTFDTEFEELYVNCDLNLIERIVLNILSNSVKYGYENGNIEVKIYKEDDNKVAIIIKDDGIGIPKEIQDKIFDRFQRADNGFSRCNEGSGIGLSIVKSLVDLQNGTIELNSEVNAGAEFILKFKTVEEKSISMEDIKLESNIIEKVDVEFSDIYV